jgi:hypothetical protein
MNPFIYKNKNEMIRLQTQTSQKGRLHSATKKKKHLVKKKILKKNKNFYKK